MAKCKITISFLFLFFFSTFTISFTMLLQSPSSAATISSLPCDFFGDETQSGTLKPGNTVSAEDPDGIVCGSCFITTNGRYGFLTAYPDDPITVGVDEGAIEDNIISFYLNGSPATNTAIWHAGQTVRSDIDFTSDNHLENAYQFLYNQMDKYIQAGEEDIPRLIESYSEPYPYNASGDPLLVGEGYVYDNALSMIALLVRGTPEDMRRAKLIGEAFVQVVDADTDGRIRDVYHVNNIHNIHPTWCGRGSGCGNIAWVINALLQYYKRDPYQPFFDTAVTLAQFIENEYKSDTGGYINGYAYYWGTIKKMTYKVSEQNIITHAALMRLYEIMKEDNIPGYNDWHARAHWAKSFVTDQAWYEEWGMYLAGTTYEKILDANCHAIMTFNDPVRNTQILNWLENNVQMTCSEPGCGFTGFAFDDKRDGVWFEGTAYMAMVYQLINDIPTSDYYLNEVERAQTDALGANGLGIVAACHNEVDTYFHDLFSSPHLAATASYILAKQGYNVLWMIPNGVNETPLANAGEEQEVCINMSSPPPPPPPDGQGEGMLMLAGAASGEEPYPDTPVTLDGSLSWDCNNDSLIYNWTIIQKPSGSTAELDNPNIINPTFIADLEGTYIIQLIVNDGEVDSTPDTVTITAVPNSPPVLDRPIPNQRVNEHDNVQFTVTSTDPDGHIPIYSLEEVPEYPYPFPQGSTIDPLSGEFIWKTTFDDQGDYVLRLKVIDEYGGEDYEDIIIIVDDIPVTRVGFDQTHTTIQDAINDPSSENIIYVYAGTYYGDITMKDGKTLIGENPNSTIPYPVVVEGNIICTESNSTIETIEIIYQEGSSLVYTNTHYNNLNLLADAGITAIDSEITVRNCIIMPQIEGYGKGIQIWNMYGTNEKNPTIKNNLILKADTGIYLFSQAFGGAISGEISSNTLDQNKYGISLRMHQENPLIGDNIITNCARDGIHYTYDDGTLLDDRKSNVVGNDFFENFHDIWCDSLQSEIIPTGEGNIYQDPEYADPLGLDYTPLNPACEGKGFMLE